MSWSELPLNVYLADGSRTSALHDKIAVQEEVIDSLWERVYALTYNPDGTDYENAMADHYQQACVAWSKQAKEQEAARIAAEEKVAQLEKMVEVLRAELIDKGCSDFFCEEADRKCRICPASSTNKQG